MLRRTLLCHPLAELDAELVERLIRDDEGRFVECKERLNGGTRAVARRRVVGRLNDAVCETMCRSCDGSVRVRASMIVVRFVVVSDAASQRRAIFASSRRPVEWRCSLQF
jgi:hypothetical protein